MTVRTVAHVNSEGEVVQIYTAGGKNIPVEGEYSIDPSQTVVHIDEVVDQVAFMRTKYRKDGEWKDRDDKSETPYFKWKNYAWELDSSSLWVHIREDRDKRLFLSDWTQLADSPLSSEVKGYWVTYRQSLRDITKDLKSDLDTLDGFAWPTAPS